MLKQIVLLLLCLNIWSEELAQLPLNTPLSATNALSAEIHRLKAVLTALKLSPADEESYGSLLHRCERAVQAGHIYLGLHLLQYAAPVLAGYEYRQAKAALGKGGLTAFEQEWRRCGPELAARQRKLSTAQRLPLAVQAVIERALTQTQPNYQSSLLYGQETAVESGLFYLGLAKAHLDFVDFCRQLGFDAPRTAPPLRSPAPELAELEKEVLAAYRQFDTPEQHGAFIRVNSLLKVAQDLQREQRYSGAWLQALEAQRALTAINVNSLETHSTAALLEQRETCRARLSNSATDQSLGWLYWQMAEAALATDDLTQANVILHHVLPRYFKSLTRNKR